MGETVTFRANVYNEAFADVVYACGAGDMVMKNGVMQSGLSTSREPRTLLGVRDDGSATALVHDGRLEISRGVSLKDAAQLLANKGCTNIVNLDGGGSSAEAVRQPGSSKTEVVNIPSEGSLRKCANYLMFVNTAPKTGEEAGSFVFPHSAATLKGARITTPLISIIIPSPPINPALWSPRRTAKPNLWRAPSLPRRIRPGNIKSPWTTLRPSPCRLLSPSIPSPIAC